MTAFTIRPAKASDYSFISNSYLKSYRTAPEAQFMMNDVYYPEHVKRLEFMTKTGKTFVACASDDPDQILGYLIIGKAHSWDVIHYLYVKYPFRHIGIAKALVGHASPNFGMGMTLISHLPKNYNAVSTKYKLVFDPQYARGE